MVFSSFAFFNSDAPECRDILSETNRQQSFGYGSNSDNRLVPGWYRFQSNSYSRMVDNVIPVRKMQLWSVTGWLNGEHPTFEDSIVGREVCFHGLLNCCYRTVQIRVRESQSYYVYELINPSPTERFSRYCASAWTLSSALSIRQDSINRQHALIIIKKTVSWTDVIENKTKKGK